MSNESEKVTINLGIVELAQIDVLIGQGIYSNRTDFIRTAVRKHLETYSERMEIPLPAGSSGPDLSSVVGIADIRRKALERLAHKNETMSVNIIGMLIIDNDIDAELFLRTVDAVVVRGKLIASDEIRDIIEKMN
jgi:Arc/MetJ-type ribon-helix-helix transcriptional regulator